jgi:glucose/arabinose dehydrogenase
MPMTFSGGPLRFPLRVACAAAAAWLAAGATPARDTAAGLRNPTGIALDDTGALYVASAGDSSIVVFAPGAGGRTAPARTIAGPGARLIVPQGLALDSRGRIYTTNQRRRIEGKGSITVYPPGADGNAAPVRTIAGHRSGVAEPVGLALDLDGVLYVAHRSGAVAFAPGADGDVAPVRSFPSMLEGSGGGFLEVSGATDLALLEDGTLLVADGRAVTAHLGGGWMRRYDVGGAGGVFSDRPHLASGRGAEFYVTQPAARLKPGASSADSFLARFPGKPQAVAVYAAPRSGDTLPTRILAGARADLGSIADLAVGRDGSLYVVGTRGPRGSETRRIAVFPPKASGEVPPVRVIEGPRTGLINPTGIAVDRAGRIYVTNQGVSTDGFYLAPSVTVYAADAAGDAEPIRTLAGTRTGMSRPGAAVVADDGTLYVANRAMPEDDQGSVTVHAGSAAGGEPPLDTLFGPGSGLTEPRGLALGLADTLFVAVSGRSGVRVNVYPPGAGSGAVPARTLAGSNTGLGNLRALAVDAAGRLYVADSRNASGINAYGPDLGDVSVHRAGAAGNEPPLRTITGSQTRLNGPGVPAVDRSGNLYVPNRWGTGPGSVTVYGPSAEGDVRPLRIISGPATGLRSPSAVTLDPRDTLYVANDGIVTVYPPGATGNVAPVRTIDPR